VTETVWAVGRGVLPFGAVKLRLVGESEITGVTVSDTLNVFETTPETLEETVIVAV
jgi:DNA-binding protein YbaB